MRKLAVLVALLCIVALASCATRGSVATVKSDLQVVKAIVESPQTGNAALGVRVGKTETALADIGHAVAPVVEPAVPSDPAPAAPSAPAPKAVTVVKGMTFMETIVRFLIGFVVGVIVASVMAALEPAIAAKVEAEEGGILTAIMLLVHNIWSAIFGGKKKAATTPKTGT